MTHTVLLSHDSKSTPCRMQQLKLPSHVDVSGAVLNSGMMVAAGEVQVAYLEEEVVVHVLRNPQLPQDLACA